MLAFQIPYQQNSVFDSIVDKLKRYVKEDSPEKIYVHTDKNLYVAGDTIWFKTYLVDGVHHLASTKSNVVYVELLDAIDRPVVKKVLNTNGKGVAHGDLVIDQNLSEGKYTLRSYTKYMFNQKEPVFFQQDIQIWVGAVKKNAAILESDKMGLDGLRPDVQFFPEGGDLVAGLFNIIGIKAADSSGNYVTLRGKIVNGEGDSIATINTHKFGLGTSGFVPDLDKKYYAAIPFKGDTLEYVLPSALPSGMVLRVENKGDHLILRVNSNTIDGLEGTVLLGHLRGNPFFKYVAKANDNRQYSLKLLTDSLSDGVAHFTLFTAEGEPICERLVFIDNPKNDVKLSVTSASKNYGKREKVNLDVALSTINGKKLGGNFSMTVFNIGKNHFDGINETDIKSWLLLDSDVKGHIPNPSYFFKDSSEKRRLALDALMMTHGWRRFTWKQLLDGTVNPSKYHSPEKGIEITGKTTSYDDIKSPRAVQVTLGIFEEGGMYQEQKNSNVSGDFSFGPFAFQDSIKIILDAINPYVKNKKKAKNISILVDSPWPENIPNSDKIVQEASSESILDNEYFENIRNQAKLKEASPITRLEGVVLKGEKPKTQLEIINEKIDAITLHGKPDQRLFMDSIKNFERLNVLDIINTLPGVQVKGDYSAETINFETSQKVRVRGGLHSIQLDTEPHYLLDGVQVPLDALKNINPRTVKFVDLLVGGAASIYGVKGANGVIAVYTDRGKGLDLVLDQEQSPGVTTVTIPGFYKAREFYSPSYSKPTTGVRRPDYRTTLFWKPEIYLTPTSVPPISFFTGDNTGNYLVEVEGLTTDGKPITATFQFVVE
ncbi:MG2 domain-containing protein [Allomuricauda sp. d1]|uniref:MG2 domain-containing protein n=1 Tax=Allomuricauda sp. d1 TaxID=3136725 RepID=UPI0031DD2BD2